MNARQQVEILGKDGADRQLGATGVRADETVASAWNRCRRPDPPPGPAFGERRAQDVFEPGTAKRLRTNPSSALTGSVN